MRRGAARRPWRRGGRVGYHAPDRVCSGVLRSLCGPRRRPHSQTMQLVGLLPRATVLVARQRAQPHLWRVLAQVAGEPRGGAVRATGQVHGGVSAEAPQCPSRRTSAHSCAVDRRRHGATSRSQREMGNGLGRHALVHGRGAHQLAGVGGAGSLRETARRPTRWQETRHTHFKSFAATAETQ